MCVATSPSLVSEKRTSPPRVPLQVFLHQKFVLPCPAPAVCLRRARARGWWLPAVPREGDFQLVQGILRTVLYALYAQQGNTSRAALDILMLSRIMAHPRFGRTCPENVQRPGRYQKAHLRATGIDTGHLPAKTEEEESGASRLSRFLSMKCRK